MAAPADHGRIGRGLPAVPLGQIAGVPVGAEWSALLLLILLAQILATSMLPDAASGYAGWVYWVMAVATAVLFGFSLLAHEVAHAAVARRFGVPVRRVTLWLLGGVTQLDGEPHNPREELLIAMAGPLTSLAAALLFFLGVLVAHLGGASGLLVSALAWLAEINLILGVFNLLPGAPLDGGRVVRATLWRRYGDHDRAAIGAARAGRRLGFALVLLGLAGVMVGWIGGLWLGLVGWFLAASAGSEAATMRLRRAMAGHTAADIMSRDPVCAPAWLNVHEWTGRLAPRDVHHRYPVVDFDGEPVGMVSMAALTRVPAERRPDTRIRDVSVPLDRVPAITEDEPLDHLLAQTPAIWAEGLALVLSGRRVAGVITPGDLSRLTRLSAMRPGGPDAR